MCNKLCEKRKTFPLTKGWNMRIVHLAPDECKGCSLINKWGECKVSPGTTTDIPGCPCKDCLVKITCGKKRKITCTPFVDVRGKTWAECFKD